MINEVVFDFVTKTFTAHQESTKFQVDCKLCAIYVYLHDRVPLVQCKYRSGFITKNRCFAKFSMAKATVRLISIKEQSISCKSKIEL